MKRVIIIVVLVILAIFLILENRNLQSSNKNKNIIINNKIQENKELEETSSSKVIDDWRIVLVNYENALPDDFEPELSDIDSIRKFDSRAIDELMQMINDMKLQGNGNIWPQSTYRSIERQEELFNKKIRTYMNNGKTREEAEKLALKLVNRPGTSEHNLGLAVDFNNVDYKFELSKEYKWLTENAENYGFVLRYPRDKKEITKVDCEPWHWRYVGKEHAKKMNELDMCLEEYVEYLKEN